MDTAQILAAIAAVIKTAVDLTPTIISAVEDATPFARAIYGLVVKGTNATQADVDAMLAEVNALNDDLQRPLPPDDGSFD